MALYMSESERIFNSFSAWLDWKQIGTIERKIKNFFPIARHRKKCVCTNKKETRQWNGKIIVGSGCQLARHHAFLKQFKG